jgi:hypothetical protein
MSVNTVQIPWNVYFTFLPERTGAANYDCYTAAVKAAMYAAKCGFNYLEIPYLRTDIARNAVVREFLRLAENPNDVLVMLDADHKYNPSVVLRLASHKPELGVISALLFRRGEPFDPLVFARNDDGVKTGPTGWEENSLIEGDSTGSGVVAIRRWVFDKLVAEGFEAPFFRYEYIPPNFSQSEDVYFAELCENAGIKHYADATTGAPHLVVAWADQDRWWRQINMLNQPTTDRVSVIIPSAGRPKQCRACVDQLLKTTEGWDVECIVIAEPLGLDASHLNQYAKLFHRDPRMQLRVCQDHKGPVRGWNYGAELSVGQFLVFGADDLNWHDGWLAIALDAMNGIRGRNGLVGFNDGITNGNREATHFMMSRDFCIEYHGGVLAFPSYYQYYTDVESWHRAKKADRYRWAFQAKVEHMHPQWDKAERDATYDLSSPKFGEDKTIFTRRLEKGFPNDFEAVVT